MLWVERRTPFLLNQVMSIYLHGLIHLITCPMRALRSLFIGIFTPLQMYLRLCVLIHVHCHIYSSTTRCSVVSSIGITDVHCTDCSGLQISVLLSNTSPGGQCINQLPSSVHRKYEWQPALANMPYVFTRVVQNLCAAAFSTSVLSLILLVAFSKLVSSAYNNALLPRA